MSEGVGMGRSYQNRRAYNSQPKFATGPKKGRTKLGAGTGSGIMKYAGENYQQTGIKKAIRETSNYTRTDLLAKDRAEENKSKPVRTAPKAPTIAQKRAAFAAANAPTVDKISKPSLSPTKGLIGVAGLSKVTPKAMNVTPSRTYTDKEKQINTILMTGKKKDGTMKASAQRKIQRIRRK